MYRKVLSVIIGIILVSIAQAAHAQNPIVANALIEDISEIITFEKGLYIVDAFNPYIEDGRVENLSSDVDVGLDFVGGNKMLNENIILDIGGVIRDEGGWALLFYHIGRGVDIFMDIQKATADDKYNVSNSPQILGFHNGVMVIYIYYSELVVHQRIPHRVIFRVSGDWEQFGIDIPDSKPSADLNGDGKVNQADLLLFMGQWKP